MTHRLTPNVEPPDVDFRSLQLIQDLKHSTGSVLIPVSNPCVNPCVNAAETR